MFFPAAVLGKALYYGKIEMIRRSEVIAIVNITSVESTQTKGEGWTYSQVAKADVEKVLKGAVPKTIELYGGEDFTCAQCLFGKGRALVFLKHDKDLLTGANWHFSSRKIVEDRVEWFKNDRELDDVPMKIELVVGEIEALLREGN